MNLHYQVSRASPINDSTLSQLLIFVHHFFCDTRMISIVNEMCIMTKMISYVHMSHKVMVIYPYARARMEHILK